MQLAQAVSGATPELWASVMRMTGKDCGFEVKAGDTCPPNEELKVQAFSDPSCKA